jgi:hypothetical protein
MGIDSLHLSTFAVFFAVEEETGMDQHERDQEYLPL